MPPRALAAADAMPELEGGGGCELPVSRDVQPAVRNDGLCGGGGAGGASAGGGGGGGGDGGRAKRLELGGAGGSLAGAPTVAQPDFAKPPRPPAAAPVSDIDAQPDRLGAMGSPSMSMPSVPPVGGATAAEVLAAATGAAAGGLGILIPAAAAILRSSFSSRLRSFSLRLSTSS